MIVTASGRQFFFFFFDYDVDKMRGQSGWLCLCVRVLVYNMCGIVTCER